MASSGGPRFSGGDPFCQNALEPTSGLVGSPWLRDYRLNREGGGGGLQSRCRRRLL